MHIKTGQVITFAKKGRLYFRANIIATIDNVEVFAKYFSTVPVASKTEYNDAAIWSTDKETGIHTVGRIPDRPRAIWNGTKEMKTRKDQNTESAAESAAAPVLP